MSAANSGVRTLVVSTDPAHSLFDALGETWTPGERDGIRVLSPMLSARQISSQARPDSEWPVVHEYLVRVIDTLGGDPVLAHELASIGGVEQVLALVELAQAHRSGEWELIVVDCAPTADTLRLLALPDVVGWYVERLLPAQRGLIKTLRPAALMATGMPAPSPSVVAAVSGWLDQLRDVRAQLTDQSCTVRLVVTPERVVLAESRRTWTALSLQGFTVDGVVVNRVPPPESSTMPAWVRRWCATAEAVLTEVGDSFPGLDVVRAPFRADEPVGIPALAQLAGDTYQPAGVSAAHLAETTIAPMRIESRGREYVLHLPLPLVSASEVRVQRRGDDLILGVGAHRRILSLPAALQRCQVRKASVRHGELRVTFVPDDTMWPRVDHS